MRHDDPLQTLEVLAPVASLTAGHEGKFLAAYEAELDALERMLEEPGPKPKYPYLTSLSKFSVPVRMGDALLRRTEDAARTVWRTKGANKGNVEEGLLRAVAFNGRASSLAFFQDALAFNAPRDVFTSVRRRWAVAGIAFAAHQTGDAGAAEALDALLDHDDLRVRTWAVNALAQTRRTAGDRLTAKASARLEQVAREDRAFEPRYLANAWLLADERKVVVEPKGGVYAFKATLSRASRTVELKSEHTMSQLAHAIVSAFDWDHDHLYEFTLSEELKGDLELATGEEGPVAMPVGALGMTAGHRFSFLYDFGDSNVFAVQLVEVRPKANAQAKYPRVAATSGRAPAQYGW